MIFAILLVLLNYFPFHASPKESARQSPDVYVNKIAMELAETCHDVASVLCPTWDADATERGLASNNRQHRHLRGLSHPIIVWTMHSYANFDFMLTRAETLCFEHVERNVDRNKPADFKVAKDLTYLRNYAVPKLFEGPTHAEAMGRYCGETDPLGRKLTPKIRRDLQKRRDFCAEHGIGPGHDTTNVSKLPRFFPDDVAKQLAHVECTYEAYRLYVRDHKPNVVLRYIAPHHGPPSWLPPHRVQTELKSKPRKRKPVPIDAPPAKAVRVV